MLKALARFLVCLLLLGACGCAAVTPSPPSLAPSASTVTRPAIRAPGPTSSPTKPQSPDAPSASPSVEPFVAAASPLVRASARDVGDQIVMAPGSAGSLYVAFPTPDGSVVVSLFDASGRPSPGWPIEINGATACQQVLPAADRSVRLLCRPAELNHELNYGARAFAFDSEGSALAGWPVDVAGFNVSARVIGDRLTLVTTESFTDVVQEGVASHGSRVVTVAADGSASIGQIVPTYESCCGEAWTIGPDGVAYSVANDETTEVTAIGPDGVIAGRPIKFGSSASLPSFDATGRLLLTVATKDRSASRVVVIDPKRWVVTKSSAELSIETVGQFGETGGCSPSVPISPLVDDARAVFVLSEIDPTVIALSPSLQIQEGWPYRTPSRLNRMDTRYVREDAYCPVLSGPGLAPDGTLYLPLEPTDPNAGGKVVAIGLDGRIRPGWPVELRRAGAEFWSVVTDARGTVFALAIELESGNTSSATIIALAPDSTVRYTTTLIDPRP